MQAKYVIGVVMDLWQCGKTVVKIGENKYLNYQLMFLVIRVKLEMKGTSIYPSLSGSSSSMIKAAYSSACSFNLDSLLAEALNIIIYTTSKIFHKTRYS